MSDRTRDEYEYVGGATLANVDDTAEIDLGASCAWQEYELQATYPTRFGISATTPYVCPAAAGMVGGFGQKHRFTATCSAAGVLKRYVGVRAIGAGVVVTVSRVIPAE
ncbi:MAG: hypothetical protein WCS84_12585 [Nocardioides sp.]|jgi:hypothetical protein